MEPAPEAIYKEIIDFISGSAAGLLQLLVATAKRATFERIICCPTYPVPAKSAGLAAASSQFRDAMVRDDIHPPTFLARLYASVRNLERRKYAGQFFTAAPVAEWALSRIRPLLDDHVCDAGVGTGVFAYTILQSGLPVRSYVGIENEPILALCAAHVLESINAPAAFRLWYANFLLLKQSDFGSRGVHLPTFIISNPPFVRFHNLKGRGRIRKELKSALGLTLSSLSGSANYFLSRAANLATPATDKVVSQRRLLFFLPKEAEGAAHTRRLWDGLEKLHGWSQKSLIIPQEQTGIDRHPSNALALLCLFEKKDVSIRPPSLQPRSDVCVGDILQVKRGISTGCNDFFVLTDEEARDRKLPRRYLRAVLPTRIPIRGFCFTKADWEALRRSQHPCWLLCLPKGDITDFEPAIQEYLKEGLRRGVHATPTAVALKTWFSMRIPSDPPDVFITYLFRGSPRFLVNQARVLNLTNILGGRFVSPVTDLNRQEFVVNSLNRIAEKWIKDKLAGREYKGGLMKIEPRELSMLPIDSALFQSLDSRKPPSASLALPLFQ